MYILTQLAIDSLRWESLVTSYPDTNAGMTADTAQIILCIAQEQHIVVRIRSVGRVSQPEVLPYHDTMLIASLVESLVANLSYPVTNHGAVHLLVIPYSNIVLT